LYTPPYHSLTDVAAMHSHIVQYPLGSWVSSVENQLVANHIPFLMDSQHGAQGRLLGHVSRANSIWRKLSGGTASIVTFLGPHAYISPSWYPGRDQHGKVVPTWNYVTVHAHGVARAVDDTAWISDMLNRLTDAQEALLPDRWQVASAPSDYIERMIRAVVGIEITIGRLEGRRKLSQDEDAQDRKGTVRGLKESQQPQAGIVADLVLNEMEGIQSANGFG
jgi:transcriptional regulator